MKIKTISANPYVNLRKNISTILKNEHDSIRSIILISTIFYSLNFNDSPATWLRYQTPFSPSFLNLRGESVPILVGLEEGGSNPWLNFFHEVKNALEGGLSPSEKIKEMQVALTWFETESHKEDWLV